MEKETYTRGEFITTLSESAGSLAVAASIPFAPVLFNINSGGRELGILGGTPVRDSGRIGSPWPYVDEQVIASVVDTTKSRVWSRIQSDRGKVSTFEKEFARLIGSDYCLGTGSGTQALNTCVFALGIGPGDEVITSPYTDMGTIASILTSRALPVMADLDLESFQLDPDDVERKVNPNTKAIMPVHIMGLPANMEQIMDIANKHNLKVIEDACQAHFSHYNKKPVGLIGDLGCFSFQASKPVACGEGGAIVGNNKKLMDRCYTVHNRGASHQNVDKLIGPKYRMNEFEGAVLLGQLPGAIERYNIRNENANYLSKKLKEVPGITPQKQYPGTEGGAYYHYALSYDKEHFDNANRSLFLKAVNAEGIPFSDYINDGLHREPWTDYIQSLRGYKTMYSKERLQEYQNGLNLPNCDRVTDETHISIHGSGPLLASKTDMDDIINAIIKVYENRDKLKAI